MATSPGGEWTNIRSLIEHVDEVAVWIVSEPGEFEYISSGIEDMWGVSTAELQNDPSRLIDGIHPVDRDRVRSIIEQSPQTVSEESYEARVVHPDETVRWVHARQIPVRDETGAVSTIVGITTDITDQKRREQEFAALNRIMRHDIRNDMHVLLAWADLLEDHLDEGGQEPLGKIQAAGEQVVELTDIAQDYAEVVAGEGEMDITPVSLRAILHQVFESRREVFPSADLRIVGEVPDIEVRANAMLSSVFTNLLNNAVQHNDKDVPVVEISAECQTEAVTVCIADNGPGIPDEKTESIFENGYKGSASSGTGIGLYLVRRLLDQYGGTIEATANTPTGTRFTIHLLRADETG